VNAREPSRRGKICGSQSDPEKRKDTTFAVIGVERITSPHRETVLLGVKEVNCPWGKDRTSNEKGERGGEEGKSTKPPLGRRRAEFLSYILSEKGHCRFYLSRKGEKEKGDCAVCNR